MGCRARYFVIVLVQLLLLGDACFSGVLEKKISYRDFELLVQQKVAEIPDLKNFWHMMRDRSYGREVYLGGGLLRGLVHWVQENLVVEGPDKTRSKTVPRIEYLLLQAESDLDMVAPESVHQSIRVDLMSTARAWDILSQEFIEDSIQAGGSTIEKIFINPWKIYDPQGGLRDYYFGKLVFNSGLLNIGKVFGNTYLALALRFIRFSQDLPELEPTPESVAFIRYASRNEVNMLPLQITKIEWWILKAFKKLYLSVGRDQEKALALFQYYEIFESLRAVGLIHLDSVKYRDSLIYFRLEPALNHDLKSKFGFDAERAAMLLERFQLLGNRFCLDKVIAAGDLEYLFALAADPDSYGRILMELAKHSPTEKLISFFYYLISSSRSMEELSGLAKIMMTSDLWNSRNDIREIFISFALIWKKSHPIEMEKLIKTIFGGRTRSPEMNEIYQRLIGKPKTCLDPLKRIQAAGKAKKKSKRIKK